MSKMMKVLIVFIFFFSKDLFSLDFKTIFDLPSNEYSYGINGPESINFYENSLIQFETLDKSYVTHPLFLDSNKYTYSLTEKDGVVFITINNNSKSTFLILASSKMIVLFKEGIKKPVFFGLYNFREMEVTVDYPPSNFSATSFLIEKENMYKAENLSNLDLDNPWVEGVKGNGIGEKIFIEGVNANAIYIFSGYLSFNKPWLFKQNARPKKIRIQFEKSNFHLDFELKDTPCPQFLDFGDHYKENISITIIDVYKGSRYNDLCVNSIMMKVY